MEPQHEEYPVLSVCIEDFVAQADVAEDDAQDTLAFARTMTDDEWRYLAELMADDLYDGDLFYVAMNHAAEKIKTEREAA